MRPLSSLTISLSSALLLFGCAFHRDFDVGTGDPDHISRQMWLCREDAQEAWQKTHTPHVPIFVPIPVSVVAGAVAGAVVGLEVAAANANRSKPQGMSEGERNALVRACMASHGYVAKTPDAH
jgi:hypothetical protein